MEVFQEDIPIVVCVLLSHESTYNKKQGFKKWCHNRTFIIK